MKLLLDSEKQVWHTNEMVIVRLLVLNEGYQPVAIDRRLLVGPNLVYGIDLMASPVEMEPAFSEDEQNRIILNPWCIYGRQRAFPNLPVGKMTFYGYLLRRQEDSLLPQGPAEPEALLAGAIPLTLSITEKD
jgi:hypothetical protein